MVCIGQTHFTKKEPRIDTDEHGLRCLLFRPCASVFIRGSKCVSNILRQQLNHRLQNREVRVRAFHCIRVSQIRTDHASQMQELGTRVLVRGNGSPKSEEAEVLQNVVELVEVGIVFGP